MNATIISQFELLVKQIQNQMRMAQAENNIDEMNTHSFRLKSVKRVLSIIKNLDEEVTDVKQLKGISGIGKGTIDRISQILEKGSLDELEGVDISPDKKIAAIEELEGVINIGHETARDLVVNHGIMSVKELKNAYKKGKIHLDDQILMGLKYYGKVEGNIPSKEITIFKKYAEGLIKKVDPDLKMIICGSYRRGKKTSGDIDMLIYHPDAKTKEEVLHPEEYNLDSYLEEFINKLKNKKVIIDDLTNKKYKMKYMGFMQYEDYPIRRLDIRWIPADSLPAALLYFTGPYELNKIMRNDAIKKNMLLNEYGLYKIDELGNKKVIKVKSEEDIFKKLGMANLTPEQREYYNTGKNKSIK